MIERQQLFHVGKPAGTIRVMGEDVVPVSSQDEKELR